MKIIPLGVNVGKGKVWPLSKDYVELCKENKKLKEKIRYYEKKIRKIYLQILELERSNNERNKTKN